MNNKSGVISILFVIDGLEFGGGERNFVQIINGLPEEKYRIFLASAPDGHFLKSIKARVHTIRLDFSNRYNFSLIPKLAKLIKKHHIKIIHGQGARAEFFARMARSLMESPRYVSTIQMPVEGYDVSSCRRKIYGLFDRHTEKFVDRFIVVSDSLMNTMIQKHEIPAAKITRIYNGIELDLYRPYVDTSASLKIRNEMGVSNNIMIGAFGRLVWQKGFDYLIKAVPEILRYTPGLKVVITGDGPLKDELKETAKMLGVSDSLVFTGFRSDIKDILSTADIVAIPSLLEGFPMITLEAMAMAKPIVSTRIDGITEQITDGVEGILVPPGDSHAFAQAIRTISVDKALAYALGSAARKKVENEFSVEIMFNKTENVYRSLLV